MALATGSGAEVQRPLAVDILERVLPDLKEMGHPFRPNIGFTGTSVDPFFRKLFDLPVGHGVMVEDVQPGGVAEAAGLAAGHRHVHLGPRDYVLGGDVIVAVNGVPVTGVEDLNLRFLSARPGEELALSVVGADSRRDVKLTMPGMKH